MSVFVICCSLFVLWVSQSVVLAACAGFGGALGALLVV